jgi:hypothetical protein
MVIYSFLRHFRDGFVRLSITSESFARMAVSVWRLYRNRWHNNITDSLYYRDYKIFETKMYQKRSSKPVLLREVICDNTKLCISRFYIWISDPATVSNFGWHNIYWILFTKIPYDVLV